MTKDDIMRMARQAWAETGEGWTAHAWFDDRAKSFERFAELVAEAERNVLADACAKALAGMHQNCAWERGYMLAVQDIEEDIRARGEK